MLALKLTAGDLRKIIFVTAEHPETIGALVTVRGTADSTFVETWREKAVFHLPHRRAPLLRIIPARGIVPDEVAPEHLSAGSTPAVVTTMRRRLASPARSESRRSRDIWGAVGGGLVRFHHEVLIPVRPNLRRVLSQELAANAAAITSGGIDAALGRLGPSVRWDPPHLLIDSVHRGTVEGSGHGVRLVPSVFWRRPAVAVDGYQVPTVVYPVDGAQVDRWATEVETNTAALLGSTRAAILELLLVARTTSEVARELGLGLPTVSVHLSTLHQNGLAVSTRTGRSVHHVITPLGRRVLRPYA